MLKFGKFETGFDIHVKGMGHDMCAHLDSFVFEVTLCVLQVRVSGRKHGAERTNGREKHPYSG